MGMRFKLDLLPALLPGEKILFFKRCVWGISGKSWGISWKSWSISWKSFPSSYRLFFSLPPLWEAGFYVTDRRILIVAYLFRLLVQEISLWIPGAGIPGDDVVREVSIGESRVWGPYLEINTNSEPSALVGLRAPRARARLFTRDARILCDIITKAMGERGVECP